MRHYFPINYFTARARFRQSVEAAGGALYAMLLDAKGPGGEDLHIDVGWLGPERPRSVLLHSSGLHGVEGFAGSAIQIELLEHLPLLPDDGALVVVHILNPYGMAWLRRVNEHNVDLNRNFVEHGKYAGAPELYARLDRLLNPQSPPSRDLFLLQAGWMILKYGMPAVKQAVAGGQYEYSKGLFFGGKCLEQGPAWFEGFLKERLAPAERVVAIDVHTGLGRYANDMLLVEESDCETLRAAFGRTVAPLAPERSSAYRVKGGLPSMLLRVLPKARVHFVGQEIGTYGPLRVLQALREENRWHHYGDGGAEHAVKRTLKEVFCPESESWRMAVIERGRDLIERALAVLSSSGSRTKGTDYPVP